MFGKRYPHSVLSTAQNCDKHGHTTSLGFTALTRSPSHQNNISHSNPNISDRLNMHTPTPPIDRQGVVVPTANQRRDPGASGGDNPSTVHPLTAAKFGAPSFASVVSSPARSPLPAISSQQKKQKQEHLQSLAPLLGPSKPLGNGNTPLNATTIASSNNEDILSLALTSSSRYHSPMASPVVSAGNKDGNYQQHNSSSDTQQADSISTGNLQTDETELEESGSSDVEIYLGADRLHDSAAQMHGLVDTGDAPSDYNLNHDQPTYKGQGENGKSIESPVIANGAASNPLYREQQHQYNVGALTSSMEFNLRVSNSNSVDNHSAKTLSPLPLSLPLSSSPSNGHSQNEHGPHQNGYAKGAPHAPVHSTIPLPEVDEAQKIRDIDARQLQHLHHHQQIVDRAGDSAAYESSIELSSLNIPRNQQQRAVSYGVPVSQSESLLSVTTSFDTTSPGGSSPNSAFPTSTSESALGNMGNKTPNVYINGLPPHFPEDQLFALASPFGEIRSVRTFTRHVRDSESGYGFVLFETVDAAERCIISLRRYRNLHPTFSKQIHKIPGTTYAQGSIPNSTSWDSRGLCSESDSGEGSNTDSLSADASFKAKMESLQDPTSTNLYMEGLPLSIDEPTLAALVSPHRISSSRFFQTRLSNPPRIIAFVRLETREGAEEIIERLHGRMVRGWNDTGSRISVRFADTSEQRELRRTERAAQEGDGSPARLTIAQAALLNLRGQDLRSTNAGPVIHAHGATAGRLPSASRQGFSTSTSAPDFASNSHVSPPIIGHSGTNLEVDYSLAPGRGLSGQGLRSRSPYHSPYSTHSQLVLGQAPLDPGMNDMLGTYHNAAGVYDDFPNDVDYVQGQRGFSHQQQQNPQATQSLDNMQQYARAAPVYTRSGYTATEEYIMRAHAESTALAQAQQQHLERRRPAPLNLGRRRVEEDLHEDEGANIAVGVRGYRAQASIGRLGQGLMSPPVSSLSFGSMGAGVIDTIGEDDFHASTNTVRNDLRTSYGDQEDGGDMGRTTGSTPYIKHNPNIHPAHVNARLSRDTGSTPSQYQVQRPPMPLSPSLTSPPSNQDSSTFSDLLNYQHAAAHMRATTLPQHNTSARHGQQQIHGRGHYQHNSMSLPAQNLRTPQHASVPVLSGNHGVEGAGGAIYESDVREVDERQHGMMNGGVHHQSNGPKGQYPNSPMFGDLDTAASSPSLISPTLTYSSQTPSTLSPATPFFGSFNSQNEGLDKVHSLDQHQQKKLTPPNMNTSSLRGLSGSR